MILNLAEKKVTPGGAGSISQVDRDKPARLTTSDGALLIGSGLSATPTSAVVVFVNGVELGPVSYGNKTGALFFSNDNGGFAALLGDVRAGSTLHINPSVAGFGTSHLDRVTLLYTV